MLQLSRQVKLQIYECQKGILPAPHPFPLSACLDLRSCLSWHAATANGDVKTHKYVKSQTRSQSQKCGDSAWHRLSHIHIHSHAHTDNFLIKRQSSTRRQEGQRCYKKSVFSRPKQTRRRVGRTQIELYNSSNKVTEDSAGNSSSRRKQAQAQREGERDREI